MNFPLNFRFKIVAISSRLIVEDADGATVAFVKQKKFKFKEHVEVFTDDTRSQKTADIKANKVLDWSARYSFTNEGGSEFGSIGRQGMRSLFKASYTVFDQAGNEVFTIQEENPMAKIVDGIVGEIPIIGFLTGYILNPKYIARRGDQDVMRLTKRPAFWEGKFSLDLLDPSLSQDEQLLVTFGFMMLTLLERARG